MSTNRTAELQMPIGETPWVAVFRWPEQAVHGPWELVIRASADAPDADLVAGISSTVLRHVDFQAAAEQARKLRGLADQMEAADNTLRDALSRAARDPHVTDQYLVMLAATYVALVGMGAQSVTARLADYTGRQPETVRQHLVRARRAGLLTTVRGKAGGELTDKAQALLDTLAQTHERPSAED
jgi:hypothetical protein